ncbi:hypothetical protein [Peristeroidobacter soli]|jgi:iron complex outermembrane receptor protein|uniref:hypothetical protein n=1 Tax=Peristeroidobacter soli TaxID=2497877 RepID=UPI00101CF922|nr:hypothetical protein [Peristeroidobacter soli]
MNKFAVRAGAVACALVVVPVQAQTNQESGRQLEEVAVTAQKRVENVQDVPLAVSVVSEGQMESAGVHEFADMAKVALRWYSSDAVVLGTTNDESRVTIRS